MKKFFSLFVAALLSVTMFANEGGTLTADPAAPIDPSETVELTYDGTGTNFANWEPKCFIHTWLVAADGETFSKDYGTTWAECDGDGDYAALDDNVKMTFVSTGIYTINMNIAKFFDVAEEDLEKIGKIGVIVRAQYPGENNRTNDLFLDVAVPGAPEPIPAKFYITGILGEWNPNAIKSTENSYVVENVPAGHHALKVTVDGTWNTSKGLAQISESNKYFYPDQDGNVCFSLSETANVTVTYIAGEPEVFTVSSDKFTVPSVKLVGEGEAFGNWNEANAIVFADNNEESASHTFTLARNQHVIFKMIRGGDWLSKIGEGNTNFGLNRDFTTTSDFTRPGEGETPSLELAADLAGEYTLTWTYATGELKVTFPEPTLVNGFYLVGDFNGTPAWNVEDLTADKIFVWNKNIGEGNEEWKVTVDLHAGDEFKACYVYMDQITEYIPANSEEKYYVDNNHAGNGKTIYFQQKYNMEWGGHFYVEATTPTAVENTQAADKAVKCMENGQLIIVRDGVQYNVLGGVVR